MDIVNENQIRAAYGIKNGFTEFNQCLDKLKYSFELLDEKFGSLMDKFDFLSRKIDSLSEAELDVNKNINSQVRKIIKEIDKLKSTML